MKKLEQLIYNLLAYINNSLEKDINYSIATSLLTHLDKLTSLSLEEAADICNVAPSTINRFCKRIGFRNFSNLRNSVMLQTGKEGISNTKALSRAEFEQQVTENNAIIEANLPDNIHEILSSVYQANRIIILAFEKHQVQALELQKRFFLLGKYCECSTNLFKQLDALSNLESHDVVITISIHGNILTDELAIMDKIKAAKGKKILFTFSNLKHYYTVFDHVLRCGKIENSAVSTHTLLRLFDLFVLHYQNQYRVSL